MESYSNEFKISLCNLLKARFPYLYIATWEEDRLLSIISSVIDDDSLIKTKRKLFTWKITTGLSTGESLTKKVIKDPIEVLDFIEKYEEPAIFVLIDFHIYFGRSGTAPDIHVIRKIRDVSSALKRSLNPKNVIFVSPSLILPDDLQKEITIVDFELPSFDEIISLIEEMIETNKRNNRITVDLDPHEKECLARASLGLTLEEAENAFARSMVEDGCLNIEDLDVVIEEKRQIIKKTEILEFISTDLEMSDVGGLENLKTWLKKRNKSWFDSAKRYGISAPRGVLITGVPGCGKSLIVKAISSMWQLPFLRLDIGKVFSGVVGSSEKNMREAIKIAETISPCILWIDEIEKAFGGIGGGDGGTSERVFGTFLTWMQEKTKPVFVAATANNIRLLPPEFLRKGRFDEIFFVDMPTHKERVNIFQIHIKKRLIDQNVVGDFELSDELLYHLADLTEGYSGSEIEQVVISALFDAFSEDRSINLHDFEKAIISTVPLSKTQEEEIMRIREWANVRAVAATSKEDSKGYQNETADMGGDVNITRGGRSIDV
ncbi:MULTISPECIES: AAA family ATPase [Methanobacterium]|uniref:Uncharacterized AAA domain-containing protein ycf46 n=1 Tax=Methanobacterium bryantii TaxID=2161 RepID=A0A2A2HA68_METBR|nr:MULTISPECIES: AAA family ATPase [Methanobacterium]OEC87078.1 ATPase [Methanobacterium sp. A39]PAV06143.1 ATPase [Methanobacterium bryantii]